jgi:hypothetical protein
MSFLKPEERTFLKAIAGLVVCNPFLPERISLEKEALGPDFREADPVWSLKADLGADTANLQALRGKAGPLADTLCTRLKERPPEADLALYEDLVLFVLYYRFHMDFHRAILHGSGFSFYREFARDAERLLKPAGRSRPPYDDPPHLFACCYQIRRAFNHIFGNLVGTSMPAAGLRAAVWQSIFTHDIRRYRRVLYNLMGDVATLVTGPTGTGKELVARAVGLSRYLPFDPKALRFTEEAAFLPLNLSALSPALLESELFGYRRGAFTGAAQDRQGWLESCPASGAVFLDEIGEIDPAVQVKLLRVLETRRFQRLGDPAPRVFRGKVIAATHRDLEQAIAEGRFREDFYYRLCADRMTTPTLGEQLAGAEDELAHLLRFIARRLLGETEEAGELAREAGTWIAANLGAEYSWPGNVRELEQCVRNVMIRKSYLPRRPASRTPREALIRDVGAGTLTADALLDRYCTLVYTQVGTYGEAARRLGLDRRTVKSRVDPALLESLRKERA